MITVNFVFEIARKTVSPTSPRLQLFRLFNFHRVPACIKGSIKYFVHHNNVLSALSAYLLTY